MSLPQLSLLKEGEVAPKLALNLAKSDKFTVELWWSSKHDLDAHALLATNAGNGAKVSDFAQVLSTYNWAKHGKGGILQTNADGQSFSTPDGALTHSGDATTGEDKDIDEIITIDGAKVPASVNEIPIFVTIHHLAAPAKFAEVENCGIQIRGPDGVILAKYELSKQFAEFDGVQMGTLVREPNGSWHYAEAASGFKGDFNTILGYFS